MLTRLQHSGNKLTASKAKQILNGQMKSHELKSLGGFFTEVLNGDLPAALNRADNDNYKALKNELA